MEKIKAIAPGVGAGIGWLCSALFGPLTPVIKALLLFMGVDYASGLVLAGVFKRSSKSETGALRSDVGIRGLLKKGAMLALVLVAHWLGVAVGLHQVRDAAALALMVNEAISIIENVGHMGVKVPSVLSKAIDALRSKGGDAE